MKMTAPASIHSVTPPINDAVVVLDVTEWTYATFVKVSSGVIVIGSDNSITAAIDSNGILLASNVAISMILSPSTKIWAVADAPIEVLSIGVQTLPFIERITSAIEMMTASITKKPVGTMKPGELWPGYDEWVKSKGLRR